MMKELPLNLEPPLTHYLNEAFELGVVFTQQKEKVMPWLLNYFYSFEADVSEQVKKLVNSPREWWFHISDTVFNLRYNLRIPADAFGFEFTINLIIRMINQGYYCTGEYNTRCIEDLVAEGKDDYTSPFLLFGFDENKKCFSARAALTGYRLGNIEIKYQDFYKALTSNIKNEIYLMFTKLNPEYNYNCFDVNKFMQQVMDYLAPVSQFSGINAVNVIVNYFKGQKNANEPVQMMLLNVLIENRSLMLERLKYMKDISILHNTDYIKQYNSFIRKIETVRELCSEYNACYYSGTSEHNIIDKAITYFTEAFDKESQLLKSCLDEIKSEY